MQIETMRMTKHKWPAFAKASAWQANDEKALRLDTMPPEN